jgi:hypothetical protein
MVLLLGVFLLRQVGKLHDEAVLYLLANWIGAGLIAVALAWERQWIVMILEGVWSVAALICLARARSHPAGAETAVDSGSTGAASIPAAAGGAQ